MTISGSDINFFLIYRYHLLLINDSAFIKFLSYSNRCVRALYRLGVISSSVGSASS